MKLLTIILILLSFELKAQTLVWEKEISLISNPPFLLSSIDSSGNLILSGTVDSNQNSIPYLVKLNAAGQQVFQWIAPDPLINGIVTGMLSDSFDNIYISYQNLLNNKCVIIKFNPQGNILFADTVSSNSYHSRMAISNNMIVLIINEITGCNVRNYTFQGGIIKSDTILSNNDAVISFKTFKDDIFLLVDTCSPFLSLCGPVFYKYDSLRNLSWKIKLPNSYFNVIDWDIDKLGNIYACSKNNNLSVGYLFKIDTLGILTEISSANTTTNQSIFIKTTGEKYWGYFSNTSLKKCIVNKIVNDSIFLISSMDSANTTSYKGLDMSEIGSNLLVSHTRRFKTLAFASPVISRYDQNNNLIWSFYNNFRKQSDYVSSLYANNNIIYSVNVNRNGGDKFYVFKLDATTGFPIFEKEINLLKVYPNPVLNELVNLENEISDATLFIYNSYGKLIQSQENFNGNQIVLNKDLAKGVYILKVQNQQGISSQKIIVQ